LPFEVSQSHLRAIYESIQLIEEFVRGMDVDAFRDDSKTRATVERKMTVISEAARRPKDEAETHCPGLPWRDIRPIRSRGRSKADLRASIG
jgi:uncharacterized protein with HEPN domain